MALFDSGSPVANVALSDTFNTWRVRTNQINTQAAGLSSNNTFTGATNEFQGTVTLPSSTSIGDVSAVEIGYVNGVTSAIQTQLNGKQATITGAATTIDTENLTVSRALVSDGSGKVAVSDVTSTELGYLDGVTSAIQTQLNSTITGVTAGTGLTGGGASGSVTLNVDTGTTANKIVQLDGSARLPVVDGSQLTGISAGLTIEDDTSTNASYYPILVSNTSGSGIDQIDISSTKLYFNPSTGELSATDFNSLSDIRFKENIKSLDNASSVIEQLQGVSFDWKETGEASYGLIAQDVQKVLPEIVRRNDAGNLSVRYLGLIAYLIESNKELQERIVRLEAFIEKEA